MFSERTLQESGHLASAGSTSVFSLFSVSFARKPPPRLFSQKKLPRFLFSGEREKKKIEKAQGMRRMRWLPLSMSAIPNENENGCNRWNPRAQFFYIKNKIPSFFFFRKCQDVQASKDPTFQNSRNRIDREQQPEP